MTAIKHRSYTKEVDAILARHQDSVVSHSTNSITLLFQMLIKDRVDFMLTFPSVANYNLNLLNKIDDYVMLPIDGIDEFIVSRVGCTKNAESQQLIQDINHALTQIKRQPWYFSSLTSWLRPEQITEKFKQHYHQYVELAPSGS
ncbi:hypothetical protein [Colwellia sp. MEBiC06753]